MSKRILWVLPSAVAATVTAVAIAAAGAETGPSSSQPPYLVRSQPGVVTKSVITVGDSAGNGYRMVGIPDGLGAYDDGDGTFTVLINHELGATRGIVRAHGSKGAFVSRWTIRKDDLSVVSGSDLMRTVELWNGSGWTAGTSAFDRFCSGDLAARTAYYNPASGNGYRGRIYTNGEESGKEGRAMAHLLDGTSYQLPALGRMAFENIVSNPGTGDTTLTAALDDSGGGQVYFHYGTKRATGNAVERAGLTGGTLYGLEVDGVATESNSTVAPPGTRFHLVSLGDATSKTGTQLDADSIAAGVTGFLRPEDGAWDPSDPRVFYFVTTNSFTAPSKLWRLVFDDPADPAAGGTIETVLDGSEGQKMLDNITVDDRGQVIALEDVGNQPHLGKVWSYDPATDSLTQVAQHDPARFASGGTAFLTQDEESSGVIPAPFLGEGKYLLDVQAHYASPDPELVEGGQLLVLQIPPGKFPGR